MACAEAKKQLIISHENANEILLIESITILAASNLLEVLAHLFKSQLIPQ